MTLKNLWSLNIDEAIAADEIGHKLGKKRYEVFFPVNAQLKNIDLLLYDLEKSIVKTIQVKGSRTWEPVPIERKRYGEGSSAWIIISKKSIDEPTNKVDFYIFVLYGLIDTATKKLIKNFYLIIPTTELKKICSQKKANKDDDYHFYIWIDYKGKRAFDFHDDKNKPIPMDKYLDNWETLQK